MQTFLPFRDFEVTAMVLDQKRLGKQRVENLQLLQALSGRRLVTTIKHKNELTGKYEYQPLPEDMWHTRRDVVGWTNHPCKKMWMGYEHLFLKYHLYICIEWTKRGFKDTCMAKFLFLWNEVYEGEDQKLPDWWHDAFFFMGYQTLLIQKDPAFYKPKFPGWVEGIEFKWPV